MMVHRRTGSRGGEHSEMTDSFASLVFGDSRKGNGQKRKYLVLFRPKTDVPENNSGRECCWPYLIG